MQEKNNWLQLQTDILPHKEALHQAADTVKDEDVSNYPIFFANAVQHNDHAPGIEVLQIKTNRGTTWIINITTLEELATKNIITAEKIDPFRQVYRKSPEALCFLIVDEAGARFGFVGNHQEEE